MTKPKNEPGRLQDLLAAYDEKIRKGEEALATLRADRDVIARTMILLGSSGRPNREKARAEPPQSRSDSKDDTLRARLIRIVATMPGQFELGDVMARLAPAGSTVESQLKPTSVSKTLRRLVEDGYLSVVSEGGRGRGNTTVYRAQSKKPKAMGG